MNDITFEENVEELLKRKDFIIEQQENYIQHLTNTIENLQKKLDEKDVKIREMKKKIRKLESQNKTILLKGVLYGYDEYNALFVQINPEENMKALIKAFYKKAKKRFHLKYRRRVKVYTKSLISVPFDGKIMDYFGDGDVVIFDALGEQCILL